MAASTMSIMKMLSNAFFLNFELDIAVWDDYYCTSKSCDDSNTDLLIKTTSSHTHKHSLIRVVRCVFDVKIISKCNVMDWLIYRKIVMSIYYGCIVQCLILSYFTKWCKIRQFLSFDVHITFYFKWTIKNQILVVLLCILVHSQLVV